jgi:mediator of RNA polymerase II transcription subunit 31
MEYVETEEQAKQRFEAELEFVQCLANPKYLEFLAQRRYFHEKEFVNYLQYLQYWKTPEYSKFIRYPHALAFLDLLQSHEFRLSLMRTDVADFIARQQRSHWLFSRKSYDSSGESTAQHKRRKLEVEEA